MDINHFSVTGINYRKTDTAIRSQYAVCTTAYSSLVSKAASHFSLQEVFVISTCNRTEVYGVTDDVNHFIHLLCSETGGDECTFRKLAYVKRGYEAVKHLWQVAAGLDSQILGDYEVVGQLKAAVKFAKEHGSIGMFTERIINGALQASKSIRSETKISGGTVSVSFAAIQYLKNCVPQIENKKILLIGTGKIGRNTCRNLIDYLGSTNITLINRTTEKAIELASELSISWAPYTSLIEEAQKANIILVSSNCAEPVLKKEHVAASGQKVLIDLSIPNNIDIAVKELPGIKLVNIDDLSRINDETLQMRLAEVPKANAILNEHLGELREWYNNRRHVPFLKAAKQKMLEMKDCCLIQGNKEVENKRPPANPEAIQKVINQMAVKMRCINQPGCNYIEALNEYIDGSLQ